MRFSAPATLCFGSACAADRLGASAQEVQKEGVRKAKFRRKDHLPIRYDLLYAVCRRGRVGTLGTLLGIGGALRTLLIAEAGSPWSASAGRTDGADF